MFGVPCAGCARQVRIDAEACWGCGRAITGHERAAEHHRRVERARRWLGIVALIFSAFGLLAWLDREPASGRIAGVNLALAALFATFWWWARRAPVAALASAIALHVGVWIGIGVIDRSTLLDGFVLRVAALVICSAGLRAALAARRADQVS